MFRGFEIILEGKDRKRLIVTPRICGICGGSRLGKACYALDVAWATELPPDAGRWCATSRRPARRCRASRALVRGLRDRLREQSLRQEEHVRRDRAAPAPFVGTSYEPAVHVSAKPVEVYALLGGQWPHSSFMVTGGVMCAPTLSDVTRSISLLEYWRTNWLEPLWLPAAASSAGWRNRGWADVLASLDENESHRNSDCGPLFIRFAQEAGLDKIGAGQGKYISSGTYFRPVTLSPESDDRGPQRRGHPAERHLRRNELPPVGMGSASPRPCQQLFLPRSRTTASLQRGHRSDRSAGGHATEGDCSWRSDHARRPRARLRSAGPGR